MSNEALKTWLDAMPIDDVRRRIERLEAKLADLRVLERIYGERHGGATADAADAADAATATADAPAAAEEAQPDWEAPQG
jgi:hypothetical protein